jgi:hypothetical protein
MTLVHVTHDSSPRAFRTCPEPGKVLCRDCTLSGRCWPFPLLWPTPQRLKGTVHPTVLLFPHPVVCFFFSMTSRSFHAVFIPSVAIAFGAKVVLKQALSALTGVAVHRALYESVTVTSCDYTIVRPPGQSLTIVAALVPESFPTTLTSSGSMYTIPGSVLHVVRSTDTGGNTISGSLTFPVGVSTELNGALDLRPPAYLSVIVQNDGDAAFGTAGATGTPQSLVVQLTLHTTCSGVGYLWSDA